ncbi:unnamed protein product, partial [Allacma fusca]
SKTIQPLHKEVASKARFASKTRTTTGAQIRSLSRVFSFIVIHPKTLCRAKLKNNEEQIE